jgi:hypothetical protein
MSLFVWGFIKCTESRKTETRDEELVMDGVDLDDRETKTNYRWWQVGGGRSRDKEGSGMLFDCFWLCYDRF